MQKFPVTSVKLTKFALGLTVAATLAACGGGDDGPSLTLGGTAATGLALGKADVSGLCVSGTNTATTADNGSYSLYIQGTGPCIVTVTKGAVTLRSFSTGTGNSAVNITPLTNAAVEYFQKLTNAASPSAMLTTPAAVALLSNPVAVQKRITEDFVPFVTNTLGVTITGFDFLTVNIDPATAAGVGGNAADADLERFKAVTTSTGTLLPDVLANLQTKATADLAAKPLPVVDEPVVPTGAGS